jgi:hypothetical protein
MTPAEHIDKARDHLAALDEPRIAEIVPESAILATAHVAHTHALLAIALLLRELLRTREP